VNIRIISLRHSDARKAILFRGPAAEAASRRRHTKPSHACAIQGAQSDMSPDGNRAGRMGALWRSLMVRIGRRALVAIVLIAGLGAFGSMAYAQDTHTSKRFTGAKVNDGTVTHVQQNGTHVLRLSADFKVPDTPDPHWQIVDSKGNVYLLQRLGIKGDKVNTEVTLPSYVKDVAKVQIYCAWAEAVLGETTFANTLTIR
jgi:hypothetical protein